ncbi:methyltransferase domain-containing protein [Ruegeria arenilitoris]|uniref:methyltransferase domain-containing protein n=1 Tax=Ruegeria arenilitoris TaxID=1173585 RepID=UPI001CFD579A|nr:methyltransferase domain-containing protein [Ruegeria arenilitoris]
MELWGAEVTDTADFEIMERQGWADPSIAKGYADGFEMATRLVARKLADEVAAGPNCNALDLCTGHGVVAAELVACGSDVTGLDFSEPMIELAQSAVPTARFVQGDAMAMEFPNHTFDAVTIGFGVPHFPDPERGLREVNRVLKPGGRVAFSIWRGKGSDGAFGWLFDAVERLADPSISLPAGPDAHMLVDSGIAKPMVENAGFRNVRLIDVASELCVSDPKMLFDVFDGGAVRAASLLKRQPKERRDAIRADLATRVQAEVKKDLRGYFVPAPSVVITASSQA